MPTNKNGVQKKVSKNRILQHFCTLPETRRAELLRRHLSQEFMSHLGNDAFTDVLSELQKKPAAEARKILGDKKKLGVSCGDMVSYVEKNIAGSFLSGIYSKCGPNATDAEKMYALLMSNTMSSRMRTYWLGLKKEEQAPYINKGLASIKDPNMLGRLLDAPESFAKGKSLESFAADVMKTMDLSKEKSLMEQLREGVGPKDPAREEKLCTAAQFCMLRPQGQLDPAKLAEDLGGKDWQKSVDPFKTLKSRYSSGAIDLDNIVKYTKAAMEEIPETEEDARIFRDAALQTCRNVKRAAPADDLAKPEAADFRKLSAQVQEEATKSALKDDAVSELRKGLAEEQVTLSKEKKGFFLSKNNTKEFDDMTKGLRLFNAKLELLEGKTPAGLTEEEAKTVRESDVTTLFDGAKQGCYNYGCMKTKNGRNTSFVHDIGAERFNASMKSLSHLNELGRKLHISEPAAAIRDEAQRQLLQNRGNKAWITEHAEDLAARSIYAQTLLNKGTPVWRQDKLLEDKALNAKIEKLKSQPDFQKMVKTVGREGLADAMIQGVTKLADVYQRAANAAANEGHQRTASEIAPADITVQKGAEGLTASR